MPIRRKWLLVAAALVVSLAALGLGLAVSPSLRTELKGSVGREPTPFTELYFDDFTTAPKHLIVGQANLVRFSIANHENDAVSYRFVLTVDGPGGTRQVDDGLVSVARGATGTGTASFTPDVTGARWVLTVQLVGRAELIHFAATS